MIGKNPLWVAKQHGHSVQTMLETYAAWTEGARESDVETIRVAMESPSGLGRIVSVPESFSAALSPHQAPEFGSELALAHPRPGASCGIERKSDGGERGIRTLEGLLTLTPLAGARLRPLGHLSVRRKSQCGSST